MGESDSSAGTVGALIGGGIPLAGAGFSMVLDQASKVLAPAALSMMKSMADKIITSKAGINPEAAKGLDKIGTSKMGFQTAYDDILYTIINYLKP